MKTVVQLAILFALLGVLWVLGAPKGASTLAAGAGTAVEARAVVTPGVTTKNVSVSAKIDKPILSANLEEDVILKVGLFSQAVLESAARPPVNVALVLDKSGSMEGEGKIDNAKRGAIELLKRLDKRDTFSLVVYDSSPRVLVPAQRAVNRDAIIERISSICAGGSTALYGGVSLGASEVRKNIEECRDNRIILLSDGLANIGPSSTADVARLGRALGAEGIVVTTVGVGLDYNEDLMTTLADVSSGNSYFAKSSGELVTIFVKEMGDTLNVAARDVQVEVACRNDAKPLAFLGRSGVVEGRTAKVSIGNLYKDKEKYALLQIRVPGGKPGERRDIASVRVSFTDPATCARTSTNQAVSVVYSASAQVAERAQDRDVLKVLWLTQASMDKSEAIRLADKGRHAEAAKIMEQNAARLKTNSARCGNDRELAEEARRCDEHFSAIQSAGAMDKCQRKRIMNESYVQMRQQTFESR